MREYCCLAARELAIRKSDGLAAPDLATQLVEWAAGQETWLTEDDVLVTIGDVIDGCSCGNGCPDCHDCDAMGCGSFSHVLKRELKLLPVQAGGMH